MGALATPWATWGIAAATAGVIVRPFSLPEWIWAVAGAALLVLLGLLSPADAATGVAKGLDVYLFLTGMMLLAELARQEGLFDWLAAQAAKLAHGSGTRLFTLVFLVGTVVTAFRRGSESVLFGLHKPCGNDRLLRIGFRREGILCGRRRASPGQARWG